MLKEMSLFIGILLLGITSAYVCLDFLIFMMSVSMSRGANLITPIKY